MYALIKYNTVHGHIDTDAQTAADITAAGDYIAIECEGIPENGSTYDPATGAITPPEIETVTVKRHISVGQFFDSFGAQKYPILASADPNVKALILDCQVRSYIDLDNAALPGGLAMLVALGFAIDPAAIINQAIEVPMTDKYQGDDRRAPLDLGWHLDKKVPLTLIFAMLMQACVVVWAIADMKKDIELVKADLIVLHQRDSQQADSLERAITTLQAHYTRMDSKLDRLIERTVK